MKYYHGTSIVGLKEILPASDTAVIREGFRSKYRDCVFVTPLKKSAETYARKCVTTIGGTPVVYEVRPVNPVNINAGQWICDKAVVINSYEVK